MIDQTWFHGDLIEAVIIYYSILDLQLMLTKSNDDIFVESQICNALPFTRKKHFNPVILCMTLWFSSVSS